MEENNINLSNNVQGGIQQPTIINGNADAQQTIQQVQSQNTQFGTTYIQQPTSGYAQVQPQNAVIGEQTIQQQTIQTTIMNPQPVQQNSVQTVQNTILNNVQVQPQVEEQPVSNTITPLTTEQLLNTKVEDNKPVQTDTSKYIVRTDLLKEYVKMVLPAAIDKSALPMTTVIEMIFEKTGLTLKTSDTSNVMSVVDNQFTFDTPAIIGVKSTILDKLASGITAEYVELEPDYTQHIVKVKANNNVYQISEVNANGEPIRIPTPYAPKEGDAVIKFNFADLKDTIKKASVFVSSQSVRSELSGVYCGQVVMSTDKNYMFSKNNQPELANIVLYINPQFCDIINAIDLGEECELYLTKHETTGEPGMCITNGKVTVSGNLHPDQEAYPIDLLQIALNKPLPHSCTINKEEFIHALKLVSLFLNNAFKKEGDSSSDKGACKLTMEPQLSRIRFNDMDGHSEQFAKITDMIDLPEDSMWLNVEKLLQALDFFTSDTIEFKYNIAGTSGAFVVLEADGIKTLLSMINN